MELGQAFNSKIRCYLKVLFGVISLLVSAPGGGRGNWDWANQLSMEENGELVKWTDETNRVFSVRNGNTNEFVIQGDGKVFAREMEVNLGIFPDYVFDQEYNLMSLHQLNEFIHKNKHLPNIPSAKEVKEEGIGLGELSRLQMEKIEELTLYILELHKRIEKLEENSINQNNKI